MYEQFLNNSLSSTLLKSKEMLLQIKNDLLIDFEKSLKKEIEVLIKKKFPQYIANLVEKMKDFVSSLGNISNFHMILNHNDFKYFQENYNKIKSISNSNFNIKESKDSFIGGFKLYLPEGEIFYDYSLSSLILKESKAIEQEFSSIYLDIDLESFQKEFESFIRKKKDGIELYLKKYDEI